MTTRSKAENAIVNRLQMSIRYNEQVRVIEPAYLLTCRDRLYVIGYCYYRNAWRTFRLRNMEPCTVLTIPARQPLVPWDGLVNQSLIRNQTHLILSARSTVDVTDWNLGKSQYKEDGYPKSIRLSKMEQTAQCRSPLEYSVYCKINADSDVEKFVVEPFRIPYTFNGINRHYIPDALVYFNGKPPALVEVKLSAELSEPNNEAKFAAAKHFARGHGWDFYVMGVQSSVIHELGHSTNLSWKKATVERYDPQPTSTLPSQVPPIRLNPHWLREQAGYSYEPGRSSRQSGESSGCLWVLVVFGIWLLVASTRPS